MEKIIHNVKTGEITQEDFNAKDIADFELMQKRETLMSAEAATKATAKAALLERLGITADEAALLLG